MHTQHLVWAEKHDGSVSKFEVFTCFLFKDGKIVRCEELTRMLKGNSVDQDLSSRT